jgi:tetratricopeptide (TPR) repeat protein
VTADKEKARKNSYEEALNAFGRAMKALNKRDYTKALEGLNAFMESHPGEKELIDRCNVYVKICNQHISPEKPALKTYDDYYRQGVFKLNDGEFEEAAKLLSKAHQIEPKAGEILYYLANTYCHMQDVDACLEYLKQAVKLDAAFAVLAQNELDFSKLREDKRFAVITKMG